MDRELEEIVKPLLEWFDRNARVLPWRDQPTPYRVWVSEIMLQQTRVEAVKPFYRRFMKALPDVQSLAQCQEEELLKLWEGLGYYNRVRNMQIAAQTVIKDYNGKIPDEYAELQKLKGIGSYTAGAVASIAYGKVAPAVDGNVLRVLSRVLLSREDVLKQSVKRSMEERVTAIMPAERPGAFNQALMELGAVVCVPNGPARCMECPVAALCKAYHHGTVDELPVKAPKKKRTIENKTVLVIQDGECTAIRKRPQEGLLAGLYELPNVEGHLSMDEALQKVKEMNLEPLHIEVLPEAKHIFSHIEWRMIGYRIHVSSLEERKEAPFIFIEKKQSEKQYAIPSAFRAYIKYMKEKPGK